jgi:histidinol phosphatase-like enzyme (inositol monophosphatase family)
VRALIPFAQTLADSSGQVIKRYFRTQLAIEHKADASPVTVADKEAEEVMRELIRKEFPTHGIIGEEWGSYHPDAEYVWTLDPIDGTKNFVSGSFLFGTLIALLHHGRPILGVIHHPLLGEFLVGTEGQAWLNGQNALVRPCTRIEDATLLATSHWSVHRHQNGAAFDALSRRVRLYRTWGDCHGYYLVATGYADIMIDPAMSLWDAMALIPIIEGAGGRITDYKGGDPVGGDGIIATAGGIHDEIVGLLNPAA